MDFKNIAVSVMATLIVTFILNLMFFATMSVVMPFFAEGDVDCDLKYGVLTVCSSQSSEEQVFTSSETYRSSSVETRCYENGEAVNCSKAGFDSWEVSE